MEHRDWKNSLQETAGRHASRRGAFSAGLTALAVAAVLVFNLLAAQLPEQRAHLQHPRRVQQAGKDMDRLAILAQSHHRIAFIHAAALVVIQLRLLQGNQLQLEAELLALFKLG